MLNDFKDVRIPVPWGHVVGRWYGNTQVRPILALHGWQDNIGTWDTLIPLLPKHIGILCVDLPGHGLSSHYPKGVPYHVIDYVHIIMRIMKEFRWRKVSLMGHSMGGVVCFIYTTMFPRKVDMFISFDIAKPLYRTPEYRIQRFARNVDEMLIANEHSEALAKKEPPAYTYDELEQILYERLRQSVDLKNTKYILNHSLKKSTKFPNKFYFSFDDKLNSTTEFTVGPGLTEELAKRIKNIPILIIKATKSNYIIEDSERVISMLRAQNQHFEMHVVDAVHHVHLNNANEVATLVNPFINHHRPASLDSWSLREENPEKDGEAKLRLRSKI